MYKMVVNYEDFNGNDVEEDVYFHMFESDALRLIANKGIGFGTYLERIVKETDFSKMVPIMEELVQISYGVKSDDGRTFDKSPEVLDRFVKTPAYSECFMTLATNANVASDFVNNLFPKKLLDRLSKMNNQEVPANLQPRQPQDHLQPSEAPKRLAE